MMADEEEQRDTSVHPRPLSLNAINNQDYVGVHVRTYTRCCLQLGSPALPLRPLGNVPVHTSPLSPSFLFVVVPSIPLAL